MKKTLATIFIASMLMVSMGGVVSAGHSAAHDTALANLVTAQATLVTAETALTDAIAANAPAATIATLQTTVNNARIAVDDARAAASVVESLPPGFEPLPVVADSGATAVTLIKTLTDWLFVILSVLAVIFIVLAGLQFITAGGNPEAIGQARIKLLYAAVGIAVALLARAVPFVITNIISGG